MNTSTPPSSFLVHPGGRRGEVGREGRKEEMEGRCRGEGEERGSWPRRSSTRSISTLREEERVGDEMRDGGVEELRRKRRVPTSVPHWPAGGGGAP